MSAVRIVLLIVVTTLVAPPLIGALSQTVAAAVIEMVAEFRRAE